MSINSISIGYGIKVDYKVLASVLNIDIEDADDNYDAVDILVTHFSLLDREDKDVKRFPHVKCHTLNLLCDRIRNLPLTIVTKSHFNSNVYFGIFENIDSDFGATQISTTQRKSIKSVLSENKEFNNLCVELFDQSPKFYTIVDGCRCCT